MLAGASITQDRAAPLEPKLPCKACRLRPLPDFKRVSAEQLRWVEGRKLGQLRIDPGQPVLAQGSKDDRLYTVLEGWAIRYKSLSDGRRQILNILLPGDLLGLQGELMGTTEYEVEALTRVHLCAFRRDTFLALSQADPSLALDIAWLSALSERFSDDILLSVGRRTALERVAMLLVHIHRRATSAGLAENGTIAFPLTQSHIADALGLSTVHTNRVLQRLRRDGLVRLAEGRLAIGDLRALRRVAEYWEQPAPHRPLL